MKIRRFVGNLAIVTCCLLALACAKGSRVASDATGDTDGLLADVGGDTSSSDGSDALDDVGAPDTAADADTTSQEDTQPSDGESDSADIALTDLGTTDDADLSPGDTLDPDLADALPEDSADLSANDDVDAGAADDSLDDGSNPSDATDTAADGDTTPDDSGLEPGDGTSEPDDGASEPDDGANEPDDGTSEPDDGTSEPDDGTSEPDDGTSEPDDGTSEPDDQTISEVDSVDGDGTCQLTVNAPHTLSFDGDNDLGKFTNGELYTPGAQLAAWTLYGIAWDATHLYLALASLAFEVDSKPVHIYIEANALLTDTPIKSLGKTYGGYTAHLPFTATHLIAARQRDDFGVGGPYNGVWSWDSGKGEWNKTFAATDGSSLFLSADKHTMALAIPWSELGCPTTLRLAAHVVNAILDNEWKETLPASHTPWTESGSGYYHIDLGSGTITTQ